MSASAFSNRSPRKTVAYQPMWTTPGESPATLRPHLGADRPRALRRLALAGALGADEDGDLAEVAVLAHELVRLGHLVEAHRAPQDRADLALLDQRVRPQRLPGVGEVRAHDLLQAHPQVAHV